MSSLNNKDPPPLHLPVLFTAEEQLIALCCPIVRIDRVKGSAQLSYRGNIINFSQDVTSFSTRLPCRLGQISMIIVTRKGARPNDLRDFLVNVNNVRNWILYLNEHLPPYAGIDIDENALNLLPQTRVSVNDQLTIISAGVVVAPEMSVSGFASEQSSHSHIGQGSRILLWYCFRILMRMTINLLDLIKVTKMFPMIVS
jgi:hypothetical protein